MTRRPFGTSVLAATLALGLLLPTSGCFEREEDTCEYWVPKLTSAAKADKALELVRELKCKDAVPTLEKLFDDGHNRVQIVRAIREIDDRKASVGLLKKALKVKQTSKVAVGLAVDWGVTEVKEELTAIMLKPTVPDARGKALEALFKIEKPRNMEDMLIKVAVEDMDFQDFRVNLKAVQELGKLKSVKAIPNLIQAAYMRAVKTGNKPALYRAVRLALSEIGPAAVPLLVKTIQEKNPDLFKFARENSIFPWEIVEGPEIMQMLTDTLDVRVVEPIVDNIGNLAKPLGLNPAAEQKWIAAQQNRFTTAMLGLAGVVQDNTGLEKLAKIINDQDADAVRQRLNAARIMAYIGTPEAQDKLLELWEKDPMWADRKKDLFRAALLVPILESIDHTRIPKLKELIGKKPSKRVKEKLEENTVKSYMQSIEQCKLDADCWLTKIDALEKNCAGQEGDAYQECAEQHKWKTVKACIMLMRKGLGDDKKVGDKMLERIPKADKSEVDMRRFPLIVLARRGTAEHGKKLLEMAAQSEKGDIFWPGEFRAVGHALIHRAAKAGK